MTEQSDAKAKSEDTEPQASADNKGGWASARGRVRDAARKSVDVTVDAAAAVGGVALKPVAVSVEATVDAFGTLQAAYNKGIDTVFPECTVPAFILPTGPDVEDYVLMFNFEEFLHRLRGGVLVRPKIELWASRAGGYDMNHLAYELERRFQEEVEGAKTSLTNPLEQQRAARQADINAMRQGISEESSKGTPAWLWGVTFIFCPPVTLLLLLIEGPRRLSLLGEMLELLTLQATKPRSMRELERRMKDFDSKVKDKEDVLRRAVQNLEIRLHPRLQMVALDLGAVDGVDIFVQEPNLDRGHVPQVETFLDSPYYQRALAKQQGWVYAEPKQPPPEGEGLGGLFRRLFGGDA